MPASPDPRKQRLQSLALAAEHVPRKLLALEPGLLKTKWPAYAFFDPWTATMRYAEVYRQAFQAKHGFATTFEAVPGTSEFLVLWRMRQAADQIQLPYEGLLGIALSMTNRRVVSPEVPHTKFMNLYKSLRFKRKLGQYYWTPTILSSDLGPQFRIEAYADLPAQDSFREAAIKLPKGQSDWLAFFKNVVHMRNYLPVSAAKWRIAPGDAAFVKSEFEAECKKGTLVAKEPMPPISPNDLWQTCFGLPGAQNLARSPCKYCPQAAGCAVLANGVGGLAAR